MPAPLQGHGLSYTQFAYSDLKVSKTEASVTVTNTGDAYAEVEAGFIHVLIR